MDGMATQSVSLSYSRDLSTQPLALVMNWSLIYLLLAALAAHIIYNATATASA
jgi:hypothetical protein